MLAFIIALLFGAAQAVLSERLICAFGERDTKRAFMFLGIKILTYIIAIWLIVLEFVWYISMIICGFAVGVPVTAIALFVYNTIYKK